MGNESECGSINIGEVKIEAGMFSWGNKRHSHLYDQ